jgi:hypothetical protein
MHEANRTCSSCWQHVLHLPQMSECEPQSAIIAIASLFTNSGGVTHADEFPAWPDAAAAMSARASSPWMAHPLHTDVCSLLTNMSLVGAGSHPTRWRPVVVLTRPVASTWATNVRSYSLGSYVTKRSGDPVVS